MLYIEYYILKVLKINIKTLVGFVHFDFVAVVVVGYFLREKNIFFFCFDLTVYVFLIDVRFSTLMQNASNIISKICRSSINILMETLIKFIFCSSKYHRVTY